VIQNGSSTLMATATPTNGATSHELCVTSNGDGTAEVTNAGDDASLHLRMTVGSATPRM
jgi:hypothetical protein